MKKIKAHTPRGGRRYYRALIFPAFIFIAYLVLYLSFPDTTAAAFAKSLAVLANVAFPLCLVFGFMVILNVVLKPGDVGKLLGKEAGIKGAGLAAVTGIISAGPIYAWYPILKDLREKGASHSSIAIFLGNRAVKPFLLPVMISYFGWIYVVTLTIFTVFGALAVGYAMGRLCGEEQHDI